MKFSIDTHLLVTNFENECNCPLCSIEKIVEENICREMLSDACMDDGVRTQVNKLGFCERHFGLMFSMPSKLSLALQIETRLKSLKKTTLKKPKNTLQAKKQAATLSCKLKTCIVCNHVRLEMIKYYKSIAYLYSTTPEWREKLLNTGGFCLKHYSDLLQFSSEARFKAKDYLNDLYSVQEKRLNKTEELLHRFCYRHDYRNLGKPLGEAENALPLTEKLFFGDKNDKNKK